MLVLPANSEVVRVMEAEANRLEATLSRLLGLAMDLMRYDQKTIEVASLQSQMADERTTARLILKDLRRAIQNTKAVLTLK